MQPSPPPRHTLAHTEADLYRFFSSLPFPMHKAVPQRVARAIARVLLARRLLATDMAFDVAMYFWRLVILIFFREIRPRSEFRIPKEGPVIFVGAPHHNQFLDPLLLASEVRINSGRRVSFLIAQKSINRRFIGAAARILQSIPVSRAADSAKVGKGVITRHETGDPHLLRGIDTRFTEQLEPHGQIVLPKETEYANTEVVEVLNDTEVRIKKELRGEQLDKAFSGLLQPDGADKRGSAYKCLPYVDQKDMYASVYSCLSAGGCLGIFPEGGSHDRTDLLPLKAGVVIMALGAMANDPRLNVKIVPVGLSYFHPHKFRSRAVVEFGKPLSLPAEAVELFKQGGAEKRKAVGESLELVYDGLKSVTVRAPDYETLMVIQAGRRLYKVPGQSLSLGDTVELNRKFIMGYLKFKDHPEVVRLREAVLRYNQHLKQAGIRDHQVERATRSGVRSVALLLYRVGLLLLWTGCALPGLVLNAPIALIAKVVSARKAKEALAASQVKLYGRDVLASWKVLVSLGVVPVFYVSYAVAATVIAFRRGWRFRRWTPLLSMVLLPAISYSTLKFGEVGIDVYKSLPPLVVSLLPGRRRMIESVQRERAELSAEMHRLIDELAPHVLENYQTTAVPVARAPPHDAGTQDSLLWRQRAIDAQGVLSHPLAYLDDWLFGWGMPRRVRRTKSSPAEITGLEPPTDDGEETEQDDYLSADFSEAVAVCRRASGEISPTESESSGSRPTHRRRSSSYRQRYQSTQSSPALGPADLSPLQDRSGHPSPNGNLSK